MIYKALMEIILAASLVQFFPVNAGVVETWAELPEAGPRTSVSLGGLVAALYPSLPLVDNFTAQPPEKINPQSLGVITAAATALVVDATSGAILFEKNAEEPRSIGSMTKLMTALIFLSDQPDLNTQVSLVQSDLREGGRQHIPIGKVVTARDLLLASLVSSDNSATAALVRLSGSSESDFTTRMNEKAAAIGMVNTTFADPTGLSPDNRSTAPDLVVLLRAALQDENLRLATEQASATITDADGRVYQLENTNELLNGFINQAPYKIIGGKTGYLPEAGYCLGIEATKDEAKNIFVIVLGSDSVTGRLRDVKALTLWTYQNYSWSDGVLE
ncbi:MAG: serine hydrolase [Candidatus Uhrbacteria bacterium]